jgi:hypothetical protein
MPLGRSRKTSWDKLNGTHQLLAYADDVNLLGDNLDTINTNTETVIDSSKKVELEINVEKTKHMLLVGKPEGRRPLGRPSRRWVDNIRWILERRHGVMWTGLVWLRIETGGELL